MMRRREFITLLGGTAGMPAMGFLYFVWADTNIRSAN